MNNDNIKHGLLYGWSKRTEELFKDLIDKFGSPVKAEKAKAPPIDAKSKRGEGKS